MSDFHIPVMLAPVIAGLRIEPGKKYIDATIGGAGYAVEIGKLGGVLLGIDEDPDAVEYSKKILEKLHNWTVIEGNFRNIGSIAKQNGFTRVKGIVFDLGVSSHELDTPERGFSYRFTNAPLDLRFNKKNGETAAQLVNRVGIEELYDIFSRFGEEELARPIARAVARARAVAPIETTGELARIIGGGPRVLSRVFQALRIAVNDELGSLKEGLSGAKELLEQHGRLVVLSFHSLEDRLVKQFMQTSGWRRVTKKPLVADREEVAVNSRARSAKLRIAEKI